MSQKLKRAKVTIEIPCHITVRPISDQQRVWRGTLLIAGLPDIDCFENDPFACFEACVEEALHAQSVAGRIAAVPHHS